jgi:hypothetical protein
MSTDCTVTTATDGEHVIVRAVAEGGRVVQLLIERDNALTLADDLTRAAEHYVPSKHAESRGLNRRDRRMASRAALDAKDRMVTA